eukprot:2951458-Amphidinium_carterae.1
MGPSLSITGRPWARRWLKARASLGIEADKGRPFMPAVVNGASLDRAITLRGGIDLVRNMISDALRSNILPKTVEPASFGTHSCKRTLLYWATAAGLELDVRRLLGGHVLRSDGSWLAYSVEGMMAPMRQLTSVIQKVAGGEVVVDIADAAEAAEHHTTDGASLLRDRMLWT